jgi:hypothetical protein
MAKRSWLKAPYRSEMHEPTEISIRLYSETLATANP